MKAFPFPFYDDEGKCIDGYGGMNLRDYFAAKAMQGMLTRPGSIDVNDDANFAYKLADAMMQAREQK